MSKPYPIKVSVTLVEKIGVPFRDETLNEMTLTRITPKMIVARTDTGAEYRYHRKTGVAVGYSDGKFMKTSRRLLSDSLEICNAIADWFIDYEKLDFSIDKE